MVTAGIEEVRDRRALRAGERRLLGDPGQGAGRPLRRGLRRAHARAGAQGVLGLRGRRGLAPEDLIEGGLRRHPPGPGLSGPARPHREDDAVRPARGREPDRREADRELRHVAGLVGVGDLHRPSGGVLFRRRQGRARPGRGLRRPQGHGRRARSSAGSGRSSTTTRRGTWRRRRSRGGAPPSSRAQRSDPRQRDNSQRGATGIASLRSQGRRGGPNRPSSLSRSRHPACSRTAHRPSAWTSSAAGCG